MTWRLSNIPPLSRRAADGEQPDMVELAGIAHRMTPLHHKVAYWLCKFADGKPGDIAAVMGISKRTLDNRLYEWRRAMGANSNGMLMYLLLGLDHNNLIRLDKWRDNEPPPKPQKIPARKLKRIKTRRTKKK